MSHKEAKLMKQRLLEVSVSMMEAAVLIDMAQAVEAKGTIYTWGHDRLAPVILKRPGSAAAKSALSGRIIPSLIAKGFIAKVADAHRGRNAEYDLLILHAEWGAIDTEMGTGLTDTHSPALMGIGLSSEWVPVSGRMGTGLSDTPATYTPTYTATGSDFVGSDAPAPGTQEVLSSPSSSKTARRAWSYLPEGFTPNAEHHKIAREQNLDLDDELSRFTDHHLANGSRKADWDAAFRSWLKGPDSRSRSKRKTPGELMREVLNIDLGDESVA